MADDEAIPPPPEGFIASSRMGPFATENGPIYTGARGKPFVEQAFPVLKRHTNSIGILHGGMISLFMDCVLAHTAYAATDEQPVTAHLSVDFLAMARLGDWVYGEGKVVKVAADRIFAEARAYVGERDIARAKATFKILRPRS